MNEFEAVDVPLHQSIAPGLRDGGAHRRAVLPQAGREAAHRFRGGLQPRVEGGGLPPPTKSAEARTCSAAARIAGADASSASTKRWSAAEIEAAVASQVRALLLQPEILVGTWLAARVEAPDLTEAEVREALERPHPLWDELFPAEQARIVRLLVERVDVGPAGADIRLRVAGLASLVRDLGAATLDPTRAAA